MKALRHDKAVGAGGSLALSTCACTIFALPCSLRMPSGRPVSAFGQSQHQQASHLGCTCSFAHSVPLVMRTFMHLADAVSQEVKPCDIKFARCVKVMHKIGGSCTITTITALHLATVRLWRLITDNVVCSKHPIRESAACTLGTAGSACFYADILQMRCPNGRIPVTSNLQGACK